MVEKMIDDIVNANMEIISKLNRVCLALEDEMKHRRKADNRENPILSLPHGHE